MSFTFNWPRFSDQFHYDAIHMLNNALNKGNKPPVIADKIEVVELEMGTEPPELEIMEIGEMTMDQFRGIFRFSYAGDAHLVLKTKVQANPLNHKQPDIHLMAGSKGMLAARQPLVVPMLLRLSHFKLRSIVVLVVSKQKGITLVFKTDPLQNVDINSTFDSIAVIQKFIQREIEGQLRQMFREDLPGIIHRLSQQWVKAKVEAPYLSQRPSIPTSRSAPDLSIRNVSRIPTAEPYLQQIPTATSPSSAVFQSRTASVGSRASTTRRTATTASRAPPRPVPPQTESTSTFPDLEHFDPTYGLRPEGLPQKSVFTGFRNLFTPNKGLADLREEAEPSDELSEGEYDDISTSFDIVDWDVEPPLTSTPPNEPTTEYETIPAVGGGLITRPRILHSQSMINEPPVSASPQQRYPKTPITPGGLGLPRPSSQYGSYFPPVGYRSMSLDGAPPQTAPPYFPLYARPITPDSLETQPSYSSGDNTRIELLPEQDNESFQNSISARRYSISSSSPDLHSLDSDPKIVLRPNSSLHQLSTLSHSNHTLSPYTRSLEHFTVRSVPPRSAGPSGQGQPVKAKRKRTFHLGGKKLLKEAPPPIQIPDEDSVHRHPNYSLPSPAPSPRSDVEFDASDMDRYFRSHDDPALHHVLLRKSYMYPEVT
ncbi:hypothetical protein C8J56DRAFT_782450 [Mycena floridula]|nr:hypothetical protein C8J56DRAFT_782450 [Mycena floridula]